MGNKLSNGNGFVKLNRQGIREMLRSAEVEAELTKRMRNVQAAVPGSELEASRSATRVRVRVKYGNPWQEANSGRLSRALDAAGGERGKTRRGK